jgi:outer membrane immunogenic protein
MTRHSLAIAAFALAVSAGSAIAADLPSTKAPILPPPPPPPMWTGFYVGLNAGYGWEDRSNVAVATFSPFLGSTFVGTGALANSADGFIGGGQIGYNYQFGNNFLVGIEADIQGVAGSNGGGARSFSVAGPWAGVISGSKALDYLGTVRGRIGYLFTPTLLLYGTGGLAYGQANLNAGVVQTVNAFSGATSLSFSDTRVGWTAGGGVEWLFLPQWSAKVEYLYYDLGSVAAASSLSVTDGATTALVGVTQASARFNGHVVRAGVNYHFNLFAPPAAPVVAKY